MTERALVERISINPAICGGRPCIHGRRIPVELILDFLASGVSIEELCSEAYYPDLTRADILACIAFANQLVRSEEVHFFEDLTASRD